MFDYRFSFALETSAWWWLRIRVNKSCRSQLKGISSPPRVDGALNRVRWLPKLHTNRIPIPSHDDRSTEKFRYALEFYEFKLNSKVLLKLSASIESFFLLQLPLDSRLKIETKWPNDYTFGRLRPHCCVWYCLQTNRGTQFDRLLSQQCYDEMFIISKLGPVMKRFRSVSSARRN